jgi:hypothetical protein
MMQQMINHVQSIIDKMHFNYPGSLYELLNNFVNGGKWIDSVGKEHVTYLKSPEMMKEYELNPAGTHIIKSTEFRDEVLAFRNTIRLERENLPKLIDTIVGRKSYFKLLRIEKESLDKADFYTNVYNLGQIIEDVLSDIQQRESDAEVLISYDRESDYAYRLCKIKITHKGSEANEFSAVQSKVKTEGGAMFNLLKRCIGYCDWTIEAKFEDGNKRWRVLDSTQSKEVEDLEASSVMGFSHIFTFYKIIE